MQMLLADGVEDACDATLEQRKGRFDGVRVNVATSVFPALMANNIVATAKVFGKPLVARIFISDNSGFRVHASKNGVFEGFARHVYDNFPPNITIALDHFKYGCPFRSPAPFVRAATGPWFPTHVCLVAFHSAF